MIDQMYFGGGLVVEPELRYTPNGHAVAQFRLAQSDYKKTEQGWEKANSRYLQCSIWNDMRNKDNPKPWAEAIADLPKGTRLVVHGKLQTRQWETTDGEKRSTLELQADSFYVDGLAGVAPQQSPQRQSTQSDPWANTSPQTPGGDEQPNQAQQQWNNATQQGQTATSGAWSQPPAQTGGFGEGEAGPPF